MDKLKVTCEIENRMERILSDRVEEMARLEELITADNAAIAAANTAMEEATNAGNLAEYQRAKGERAAALDSKEMHEKRKNTLDNLPLISEAEYRKAVADVCAELAAADDATKQKLTALSDQMNAAALDLRQKVDWANDVLSRLQHDIYRDADRTRNRKTGEIIPMEHETAHVNREFYNTVSWGRAGVENGAYQMYTGRKG